MRKHELTEIAQLQILNINFQALIDIRDDKNEYRIFEESFSDTFHRIWNIEHKYLNMVYMSNLQEFNLICNNYPMLVVLPRELLRMLINQLMLEGSTQVQGYVSVEEALQNANQFENKSFVGVLCSSGDEQRLRKFKACKNAYFYTVNEVVDQDLLEKFNRLEFDITDEREFNILADNLQTALDDLNFNLDPVLREFVPPTLGDYLKGNFRLICEVIKGILSGKEVKSLTTNVQRLFEQEADLRGDFKDRIEQLGKNKQREFLTLQPVIDSIKKSMARVKMLKHQIEELYELNERLEMDEQSRIQEIENAKQKLKNVALKQFSLAESLGNFLVKVLRKNRPLFEQDGKTSQLADTLTTVERRVFNFSQAEWAVFAERNIYFVTRYKNLARLLSTLLKSEKVLGKKTPGDVLIRAHLPDEQLREAFWVFYDKSCTTSEINLIKSQGKSLFDSQNFNEVLTKTEIDKSEILKLLDQHEQNHQNKHEVIAKREEELYSLSNEHEDLVHKLRRKSEKYGAALQNYRVLAEIFNSYRIFYAEVDRKIYAIHKIMKRLELIGTQIKDEDITPIKAQSRITKQVFALTEILTTFYFSLAFLKFTTRILKVLPQITQGFRLKIAGNELEKSKLKHKFQKPIQNVLVITDNSLSSDKVIEHLISMMMFNFRINRNRFKITDTNRYRKYLNPNVDYVSVVLTADSNQLDALKYIVQDVISVAPDALIFALCQYPASLIAELELMSDAKTVATLAYIRKHACLCDANQIKPDNKLHIASIYLYSIS